LAPHMVLGPEQVSIGAWLDIEYQLN